MKLRHSLLPTCALTAGLAPCLYPVAAQADTTTTHQYILTAPVNTCNGSTTQLEGFQNLTITTHSDGTVVYKNVLHGTGTGSDGNKYVFNLVDTATATGSDLDITEQTVLVSQGSDPNQLTDFHFTTNPYSFEFTAICRG